MDGRRVRGHLDASVGLARAGATHGDDDQGIGRCFQEQPNSKMEVEARQVAIEMMHAILNALLGLGIVLSVGAILSLGPFG